MFWPTTFPTLKLNVPWWFRKLCRSRMPKNSQGSWSFIEDNLPPLYFGSNPTEYWLLRMELIKSVLAHGAEWANISAGAIIVTPLKILKNYLWPDTKAWRGRGMNSMASFLASFFRTYNHYLFLEGSGSISSSSGASHFFCRIFRPSCSPSPRGEHGLFWICRSALVNMVSAGFTHSMTFFCTCHILPTKITLLESEDDSHICPNGGISDILDISDFLEGMIFFYYN